MQRVRADESGRWKMCIRDRIVSHNPDTVRQLCTSVLWIHEGKVRMQGDVETVLEAYEGEA